MNKKQLLVYKLCTMDDWDFTKVLNFIKTGDEVAALCFHKLKPLFDEFGYQETINMMLEIDKLKQGEENEEILNIDEEHE